MGGRFNIRGYPTILFFGARKDEPVPFNGARNVEGLTSFVFEQTRSIVEGRLHDKSGGSSGGSTGGSTGGQQKREEKKDEGNADDKDVVVLTDATFDTTLKASGELWIVEFYGTLVKSW